MIHDYYIYKANFKKFNDGKQEKEKGFPKKSEEELLKSKEDKGLNDFSPEFEDLKKLPTNSVLIKIYFTLKKPYTSKGEGEFHIKDRKTFENPIVRDKFTGLPMVRPSTWKGHLRFAAGKVEWNNEEEKEKIIRRLFGQKSGEEETLKGRLYFFPTFFKNDTEKDVITPLKRDTRTPARGPITLEVMKPGKNGEFYLLYFPYPKGKDFSEEEVDKDLKFLAEALNLMFYKYGFSAKKTSGFGVIEKLCEDKVEVCPEERKEAFSILYSEPNKTVKEGA